MIVVFFGYFYLISSLASQVSTLIKLYYIYCRVMWRLTTALTFISTHRFKCMRQMRCGRCWQLTRISSLLQVTVSAAGPSLGGRSSPTCKFTCSTQLVHADCACTRCLHIVCILHAHTLSAYSINYAPCRHKTTHSSFMSLSSACKDCMSYCSY